MKLSKLLKRTLPAVLAMGLFAGLLGGCGQTPSGGGEETKPVILVVSFGTSYNDTRAKTIDAIERDIAAAYSGYELRRAFTAQTIIDILKERDGLEIDNVEEAFERLVSDGVKTLVVQPTHVMNGYEYDDLMADVEKYRDQFDKLSVGKPLLSSDDDFNKVADALIADNSGAAEGTAVVYMGHGTEHDANAVYTKLQDCLDASPSKNFIIGTVEAEPALDDIVAAVKAGGYENVILKPLMVVAGDHATNDMAGDEDDSWKSVLEQNGVTVEPELKGLGEVDAIRQIYVNHVGDAIDAL